MRKIAMLRAPAAAALLSALAGCALLLAGCAGALPGNLQGCAGITHVAARFGPDGKVSGLDVCQGKAGESFDVAADIAAGTVAWHGKGVEAFDGQKMRAGVERAVAAAVGDSVGPGGAAKIVDSVMAAIRAGLGMP